MDNLRFMRLWDLYRNLLTPTQRDITDLYFNLDLTESEIAEQKGITRQAVHDCLAGSRKQLSEYEGKLHFDRALTAGDLNISFLITDIGEWADKFFSEHPECSDGRKKLEEVLNKDYGGEINSALEKMQKV